MATILVNICQTSVAATDNYRIKKLRVTWFYFLIAMHISCDFAQQVLPHSQNQVMTTSNIGLPVFKVAGIE